MNTALELPQLLWLAHEAGCWPQRAGAPHFGLLGHSPFNDSGVYTVHLKAEYAQLNKEKQLGSGKWNVSELRIA